MDLTLPQPASQAEIDAAHARYLRVAAERDDLDARMTEQANEGDGLISDELHDQAEETAHVLLGAAESLLHVLGYAL